MKPGRSNWSLVAMLSASATASYICRVNITTAGPLLMQEFKMDQTTLGFVFSSFLLGYASFQILAGNLADRIGARRILGAAAWLWVIITLLQTIAGSGPMKHSAFISIGALMAFRFLLGIAESPTFPGSAQGVSRWVAPHLQARANGFVIAAVSIGSALSPLLVSSIMDVWGWRVAIIATAFPALIVALLWRKIREPIPASTTPGEITADESPVGGTLRNRSFILLSASYALQGYVGYIFVDWIYTYLVQERHFGLLKGALMTSFGWSLSIISIPLGGYLSDRLVAGKLGPVWGRRIVPMIGLSLSGILTAIGAHTGSPVIAAIALAFATAFVLCVEGPFWATMMSLAGPRSGMAGGIMNTGCNLCGFISPILTPFLAKYIGWENALHLAAGLAVISGLLWLGITPPTRST